MRKLRIGAPAAALLLAAGFAFGPLRAAESDVAVDNLVFTVGATTYRIPHLELKGASLPAAELAQLFSGDEKAIDSRLARLSAKSLAIPSMTSESRSGGDVERASYRQLTVENIIAGRIGVARAAGAEQTIEKQGGGSERYLWGASLSKGIDLRQLAHLALATRLDPNEALKPVIDEESVETLAFEDKGQNLSATTGRWTITGVRARAFAAPLSQLFERLEKLDPEKTDADPALLKELVDAAASLDIASFEIRDVSATGKGAPAEKPYSVKIGRVSASRLTNAVIGDFAVEKFALVSSDGGKILLERFGLRDAKLATLDQTFPQLAHIEAKGLAADLPDAKLDAARMKFSLAVAEADFADFREVAPTKFSARLDHFTVDLAARGDAPSTAQFLALGYRDLDLSAALAGGWDEKTQEATVAPLRFEGKDMGAATLKATFGNVSSALFSPMAIVSKAAALAASLKSVDLTVEGGGLVDRLLALEAKEEKKPVDKARAEYAKAVSAAVAELGGGGEKARKIADAVAAYVMKPKRLHLRLTSERGVNALDGLAKKPGDMLESLDVEAVADR